MRRPLLTLLVAAICTLGITQEQQAPSSASYPASSPASSPISSSSPGNRGLHKGVLIPAVRSESKPEQSYALYVPSAYTADRDWPVVYVFDPGAKGDRPLKLMQDAAERYGYILAGSNNSRNGALQPELDAMNEMWRDTHGYLSIDDHRIFFAGFSGGARLAAYLAQICGCTRAVFLNGAALMPGGPPLAQKKFAAFSIAGLGDYNYGELLDLDAKVDAMGQPHFLRRFDGEHEWAPAPVWEEAFAWSALLEIKSKLRPNDPSFIAAELLKSTERVKKQAEAGESSFALQEARALIPAYEGLTDTAALKQQVAALEKDPATRTRAKQEKSELDRQHSMGDEILGTISSFENLPASQPSVVTDMSSRVRQLRQNFAGEKNASTRRVLQRVLGNIFIMCMETGGPILEKGDAINAQPYFEIAAEARPDWSWPFLSLARCHGARGDKKAALRDLKRALDTGYSVEALGNFMKRDPKLAALTDTDDYKKMIERPDGTSAK
jgi:predicted esterase